jgi:hypothetical protein
MNETRKKRKRKTKKKKKTSVVVLGFLLMVEGQLLATTFDGNIFNLRLNGSASVAFPQVLASANVRESTKF